MSTCIKVLLVFAAAVTMAVDGRDVEEPQCPTKDLSSWGYRRYEEKVLAMDTGKVTSMELVKEHYVKPVLCVKDETFGFTDTKLWVSKGCRATFRVCFNTSGTFDTIVAQTNVRFDVVAQLISKMEKGQESQSKQIADVLKSIDKITGLEVKTQRQYDELKGNSNKVNELKSKSDRQINELNTKQENDINKLRSSVNSLSNNLSKITKRSTGNGKEITMLKTASRNYIDKSKCKNGNVAFSAALSSLTTLPSDHTLVYDHVLTNNGGDYDRNTGTFTCDIPGTYSFDVVTLTQNGKPAYLGLFVNDTRVIRNHIGRVENDWNSANMSILVQLKKGDKVKVKGNGATSYIYGSSAMHTIFSGVRIPELPGDCLRGST